MRNFLDSEVLKVVIIQTPADIIMAAEIILEYVISRKSGNNIKLTAQQETSLVATVCQVLAIVVTL